MSPETLDRGARLTLFALVGILAVTVAWWALALWPTAGTPPQWLARARSVCFNAGPDGLPDVSGWMLLIGQPMGMLGFLVVVWPSPVFRGVRWLAGRPSGWAALAGALVAVLGGLTGAGIRVASASAAHTPPRLPQLMAAADHPRLDQEAPELGLLNQGGDRVTLADLEGRPALVTFAFGHCGDICPVVVESARRARDDAWGADGATLVVVTLDPWRDTPARLQDLAERWGLGPGDHVLSGGIEEVESVLDAWNVARQRDPRTGDLAHPPLVYVMDAAGTIAFATLSGGGTLVQLAGRL